MTDQHDIHHAGCECGAVRFTVGGRLRDLVVCHCGQCRRTTGYVGAYSKCREDRITYQEDRGLKWYRSSDTARRGFCGECGSTLFFQVFGSDYVAVAGGCLDVPTGLKTVAHIYVDDKADYYEITDGLPCHPQDSHYAEDDEG